MPQKRPDTYQRLPEDVQLNTCEQQPVHTWGLMQSFAAGCMNGCFVRLQTFVFFGRLSELRTKQPDAGAKISPPRIHQILELVAAAQRDVPKADIQRCLKPKNLKLPFATNLSDV